MMTEPLISVIVPVYNTVECLPKCLDSICGQSYTNLEILLVDDGSTDGSAEVLQKYASRDGRIRVISQSNAGVSAARNNATAQARGEWVTYVDSDDWLAPGILEKAVSMIVPGVDVVSFGAKFVWPDGCIQRDREFFTLHKEDAVVPATPENSAEMNRAVWGKLWRRSMIIEHGVHSPVGLRHEDDAFFYLFMRYARGFAFVAEVGYFYYQRATSFVNSVHTPAETARIYVKVLRYVFNYIKELGENPCRCAWCLDFLSRLHAERYNALAPAARAETSAILHGIALELGILPAMMHDYRFRCLVPVRGWRRLFLSRHLNTELWRFFGVPLWEVEYRGGKAVQQRFMLLRFIGWKLAPFFRLFSGRASA